MSKKKYDFRDPIIQKVVEKFISRSDVGFSKYKVTLNEDSKSINEWLNNIQEELMDAVNYIEKLKSVLADELQEVLLKNYNEKEDVVQLHFKENDGTLIKTFSTSSKEDKLIVNKAKIDSDLNENWAVIAEAIQTVLRREGYPNPYEVLKKLTRINSEINKKTIHEFIDSLEIDNKIKNELKEISPSNYTGI